MELKKASWYIKKIYKNDNNNKTEYKHRRRKQRKERKM
jgi:hypothetical protein